MPESLPRRKSTCTLKQNKHSGLSQEGRSIVSCLKPSTDWLWDSCAYAHPTLAASTATTGTWRGQQKLLQPTEPINTTIHLWSVCSGRCRLQIFKNGRFSTKWYFWIKNTIDKYIHYWISSEILKLKIKWKSVERNWTACLVLTILRKQDDFMFTYEYKALWSKLFHLKLQHLLAPSCAFPL